MRLRHLLAAFILLFQGASLQAAPHTLALDDTHSYVLWRIEHLGFSTQSGKWYAKGTLVLDRENPQKSSVDVSIDIKNIVTGIPQLDEHLMGPMFFDVKKYPKATFKSTRVHVLDDKRAEVDGILTLRGVSKPVTLHVTMNRVGKNPINDKMTVGFSATATIKRSDFGMNALVPNLGDTVQLEIGVEASPIEAGAADASEKSS
ncbi:polyprenyl-pyrophosphate binding protein [Legionella geestiana]|uniref:Polyprenyl-pyrophosphate binding protein n=1 Tax=Legionella geestiana TaxID=45065 RepID=A0A0W0U7X0_9GAMM|nr:YceI family protein [Legionella geestiana]KTD03772.1 polyprenyl-pyrophosphate binding protein [Legionella geestiana]QBS11942.1 polyisoprenoid-binding protein [Legionella geestiana]QDQ40445.1 polyisoprenoid-binding protein [Legionella geestiana]STX53345.1 polyprenyl-pyrophosphate binding protein [Legionella geestiana]